LAERSVGAMLRRLGFRRLSVRPRHPRQDPAAQETHKKTLPDLVKAVIPEHAREKPIELWWQDEARVGQQGTLTRVWAERGSRPAAPRDQRREWALHIRRCLSSSRYRHGFGLALCRSDEPASRGDRQPGDAR